MFGKALAVARNIAVVLCFCILFLGLGAGGGYYLSSNNKPVVLSKAADFSGPVSARDLDLSRHEIRKLNTSISNSLDVVEKVDINLARVPEHDPYYAEGGYRYSLCLRAKRGFDFESRERYAQRPALVARMADAITTETNSLRSILSNPVYKNRNPKRILHSSS